MRVLGGVGIRRKTRADIQVATHVCLSLSIMASVSTTKKTSLLWRSKRVSSQDQEEYVGDDEGLENEEAMLEKGHERRDKQYSLLGRWSALFSVVMGGLLIAGWVWIVMNRESTVESNKPPSLFFNGTVLFEPTVLLISLDGFRNDYLERNVTPTLTHFASKGIRAEYMQPSFPSMTFPNHWTLVTGLYPESHATVVGWRTNTD
ncbi:nucleotide pyrophosphatase-domain-containing protein [Spinellus fusiger]|nr:nucleotide pyrophosphatase-domain-containing protein [Spinellus fusiger]